MPATRTAHGTSTRRPTPKAWGQMPVRVKVLHVTTPHRTGSWLSDAFRNDSATEVVLAEVVGVAGGLSRLRDEVFDAVLVSHDPGTLDALELIEGMRGGGCDEPAIVLGKAPSSQMAALAYEVGADAYCCISETTTRSLLWTFARAVERCQLSRDHRRLVQNEQQRLAHEHQEAERLLGEQRALIAELEKIQAGIGCETAAKQAKSNADCGLQIAAFSNAPSDTQTPKSDIPEKLIKHYREMLRAYVVMGAGNLTEEMVRLAAMLVEANVSAQRTMQLHVQVLEELVASLGNRSARHVMTRADLLVLEIMAHLADSYRRRYHKDCYSAT